MRSVISYLVIAICFSSCASVYISSLRNVPLLKQKGEFQSTASVGNGANLNAAYALTDHLGIVAGGLYANNKFQHYDNTYRIHQSAEVGLGYFTNKNRSSFEVYGSFGAGSGYAQDSIFGLFLFPNTQLVAQGDYHKYAIQPTFAFSNKRFQFAWTVRVTYLEFRKISILDNQLPTTFPHKTFYVVEPSFTAKFFVSKKPTSMFVFAQAGLNLTEQSDYNDYTLPYSMLHYNIGVGIRILKD